MSKRQKVLLGVALVVVFLGYGLALSDSAQAWWYGSHGCYYGYPHWGYNYYYSYPYYYHTYYGHYHHHHWPWGYHSHWYR